MNPRLRRFACLLPALLWLAVAHAALGESATVTRSDVLLRGDQVVFRLASSARNLATALGLDTELTSPIEKADFEDKRASFESYLGDGLRVVSEEGACSLVSVAPDYRGMPEIMAATLAFRCAAPPRRLTLAFDLFFETDPTHRSLGEVRLDERRLSFVFDRENRQFAFDIGADQESEQSWAARFMSILILGFDHIAGGLDHILFLIVLAIARLRFWPVFKAVTAFAIAHTVTMGMAWFGVIDPPTRTIEILLAAVIAFVAIQNMTDRGMAWRWVVAFAFGLLHGLGFYNVLRALDFKGADAATILLAFNLGIEFGQLAVVGAVAALLFWCRDRDWYPNLVRGISLLILIASGFWIIERSLAV